MVSGLILYIKGRKYFEDVCEEGCEENTCIKYLGSDKRLEEIT
jgi:hypothetical protein